MNNAEVVDKNDLKTKDQIEANEIEKTRKKTDEKTDSFVDKTASNFQNQEETGNNEKKPSIALDERDSTVSSNETKSNHITEFEQKVQYLPRRRVERPTIIDIDEHDRQFKQCLESALDPTIDQLAVIPQLLDGLVWRRVFFFEINSILFKLDETAFNDLRKTISGSFSSPSDEAKAVINAQAHETRQKAKQAYANALFDLENAYISIDNIKLLAIDGLNSIIETTSTPNEIVISDRVKTSLNLNQYQAFASRVEKLVGDRQEARFNFSLHPPRLLDRNVPINPESLIINDSIAVEGKIYQIDEKLIAIVDKIMQDQTTIEHEASYTLVNYPNNRITSSLYLRESDWLDIQVSYRERPFSMRDVDAMLGGDIDKRVSIESAITRQIERHEERKDYRTSMQPWERHQVQQRNDQIDREISKLQKRLANLE
ncbi:MAG: hypothetical protein ACRC2R_01230 [Xenococcaceae cyanobacterium]